MYDPLCKVSDVKAWLGIAASDETKDGVLQPLIAPCSDLIGQYCGRPNLGAVIAFTENRFLNVTSLPKPDFATRMLCNYYPVIASTLSVVWNATQVQVLTAAQLQGTQNTTGVFLEDDGRTLRFMGLIMPPSYGAVQLAYQAGYYLDAQVAGASKIPAGLRQACVQFVGEIYKSTTWIGYKSKSMAGETTTYDQGTDFAMSARTKAMLSPYRNRVPWM